MSRPRGRPQLFLILKQTVGNASVAAFPFWCLLPGWMANSWEFQRGHRPTGVTMGFLSGDGVSHNVPHLSIFSSWKKQKEQPIWSKSCRAPSLQNAVLKMPKVAGKIKDLQWWNATSRPSSLAWGWRSFVCWRGPTQRAFDCHVFLWKIYQQTWKGCAEF